MADSTDKWTGIVRGKTILLDRDPGLPEGSEVTVTVQPSPSKGQENAANGLRLAFGAWADDGDALDRYVDWNRQQRKVRGRRTEA